ncbi:S-layer homology domain-containing protein [Sinomonas susongensis]|uniref:S-layer homology domain-containing protein n=1 Tax=Sinomonas susongensis TaxID=1324851 RepID=UPI001FECE8E1|nr:S-layer homology domain-containing protein [Sinomonas susongensis]
MKSSRLLTLLLASALFVLGAVPAPASAAEVPTAAGAAVPASHVATGKSPNPHGAQVPDQLKGHRHAKVCQAPKPGRMACNAVADLDVSGQVAPNALPYGYSPADLQSAYQLPGGSAGTGRTIAIVDAYDQPNAESDLATYRSKYGLPPCTSSSGCFTKLDQRGGAKFPAADAGWAQEISLDMEMAAAGCPNCRILLVEADSASIDDLGTAVNTAVAHGADAVSNSYGAPEFSGQNTYDSAYFDHPGVAVTASSGDQGYGTEYPAASPKTIAVGGTSLLQDAATGAWSESAWQYGGSGCSGYEGKPAWQKDNGCGARTEADLAAVADPSTGVAVYDSVPGPNGLSGWLVMGGTSAAAPLVAAAYAMAGKPTTDYPGSLPYSAPTGLFDPASGSNGTCSVAYLCSSLPGYDAPTGNGTLRGLRAIAPRQCGFTDVLTVDQFASDMCWMASAAISTGYPDGTYRATAPVTRDAMAAFLYRLKHSPAFTPPGTSPFTDISPSTQFYKEITWLASTGITTGYPDGTYRPLASVNRDAMAAFLYRAAGSPAFTPPATSPFTDITPSTQFYKEITWLASTGISTGYPDGTFRPGAAVTRDAMAAFMHRYSTYLG